MRNLYPIYCAVIALFAVVGCDEIDTLTQFNVGYKQQYPLEKQSLVLNQEISFQTNGIDASIDSAFDANRANDQEILEVYIRNSYLRLAGLDLQIDTNYFIFVRPKIDTLYNNESFTTNDTIFNTDPRYDDFVMNTEVFIPDTILDVELYYLTDDDTLYVKEPVDLFFVDHVEVYLKGDGFPRKKIAWKDQFSFSVGDETELEVYKDQISDFISLKEFDLEFKFTAKDSILLDLNLELETNVFIDAKVLE